MEAELKRTRGARRPARPDPGDLEAVVRDMLERARFGDYFECLGVPRDAGTTEVREAWLAMSSRLAELRVAASSIDGAYDALDQIGRVAADAIEVLSDPDLRLAYLRAGD